MNGKAEASLKQLASLSKTLNESSDELSRQIAALESALNAYKLGVEVWVPEPIITETIFTEPDAEGRRYEDQYGHQLGYGKHNSKWGLLVASSWYSAPEDAGVVSFLRDAPREVRLKAIDKMPDLLEALAYQVGAVTEEASKKAALAKEIAASLNKKPR